MGAKYIIFIFSVATLVLHSVPKPIDPKELLSHYNFISYIEASEEEVQEGLKKFQKVNNLEMTGSMNEATSKRMKSPRCGMPSNVKMLVRTKNKWQKSEITYKIANWTEPFTKSSIKNILEEAIMGWTDNVNLQIRESTSDKADIEIYFTRQDGASNVLGYAYFPEHGDIFFDQDENWTLDLAQAATRIGFTWVATHELGHAIGMPHAESMSSVMFPYYSSEVVKPSQTDTNNLRSLYGEAVLDNSILCGGGPVDAALGANMILIKGKQYWTFSGDSIKRGPFHLEMLYPGLPDKIDAAFEIRKTVYFLSGNWFYRFKNKEKKATKKLISRGFDDLPDNIDASFYDPTSSNIYFFKGSKYYIIDITKGVGKRLTVKGKDMSNEWVGVPKNVEAATLLDDSRVLFIKDSKCYVVSLGSKELLSSEDCSSTFYKC